MGSLALDRTRANPIRRVFRPDTQERCILLWLYRSPGKLVGHKRQVSADILVGIVWKTTLVGGSGRRGSCFTLGEGPKTCPSRVLDNGRQALGYGSTLLVIDRRTTCCSGIDLHHSRTLR